jgi:hypothetical protein
VVLRVFFIPKLLSAARASRPIVAFFVTKNVGVKRAFGKRCAARYSGLAEDRLWNGESRVFGAFVCSFILF